MLTLIQVQCPHCSAQGQLMVPPFGSIVMGPCPQCKELVVVFMGQALALDKEIMINASGEEQRGHVLSVLTSFLDQRLGDMIVDREAQSQENVDFIPDAAPPENGTESDPPKGSAAGQITQSEVDLFTKTDLPLLDNPSYFKSIFGPK